MCCVSKHLSTNRKLLSYSFLILGEMCRRFETVSFSRISNKIWEKVITIISHISSPSENGRFCVLKVIEGFRVTNLKVHVIFTIQKWKQDPLTLLWTWWNVQFDWNGEIFRNIRSKMTIQISSAWFFFGQFRFSGRIPHSLQVFTLGTRVVCQNTYPQIETFSLTCF